MNSGSIFFRKIALQQFSAMLTDDVHFRRSPRSERRVGDRRQRHDSGGDRDHSARNDRGNHRGERGNSRGNAREKADTNTEENVLIRIKGRGNEAAGESRGTKHAAATVDDDASEASSKDAPHKRENRRQQRDHTHKTVSTAGETTSNSDTKSTTPRGRDSKDIRNNRKERGANKDGTFVERCPNSVRVTHVLTQCFGLV